MATAASKKQLKEKEKAESRKRIDEVRSLVVEYDVEPSVYQPPTGESEFRQCGTVTTAGCALSLLNIALVPSCPLSEVTLEAHLPEDWREVVSLPGRLALTSPAAWYAPSSSTDAPFCHRRT